METRIATSEAEAVAAARSRSAIPVVLKLHSETITHKTDVGGVQLNLADAAAGAPRLPAIEASVTAKVGAEHFPA